MLSGQVFVGLPLPFSVGGREHGWTFVAPLIQIQLIQANLPWKNERKSCPKALLALHRGVAGRQIGKALAVLTPLLSSFPYKDVWRSQVTLLDVRRTGLPGSASTLTHRTGSFQPHGDVRRLCVGKFLNPRLLNTTQHSPQSTLGCGRNEVCQPDLTRTTLGKPQRQTNCDNPVRKDLTPAVQDALVRSYHLPGSALIEKTYSVFSAEASGGGPLNLGSLSIICREGDLKEAVKALTLLVQRRCEISEAIFYRILKRCMKEKDLVLGRCVHTLLLQSGYMSNTFLANHLIVMYASHGRLDEAAEVFKRVTAPNSFVWASIILAHARLGQPLLAIELYHHMRKSNVTPDNHIYAAVLKACAIVGDLALGKQLHTEIGEDIISGNVFVGNSLLNMYAKCGRIEDAREVFDILLTKNIATWITIIAAYARQGYSQEALTLYKGMQLEGLIPADQAAFACLLQACASIRALDQGKQLHAQIQENKLETNVLVGNNLVHMYAKCGSLRDAQRVFDSLPKRDVVAWNVLIAGYIQHGLCQEALNVHADMVREGNVGSDSVTFVLLLKACAAMGALQQGKRLHERIVEAGLDADTVVGNSLLSMYAKCGSLEDARQVFDRLPSRDVVTWTAMIGGYSQRGLGEEALALYLNMQQEGATPANRVTFMCLLQACAKIGALHHGKQLHAQMQQRGLERDVGLSSCLVDMYSKCGSLDDALEVFGGMPVKDVVTWNTMIGGCVQNERSQEAFAIYAGMQQDDRNPADQVTFVCLLQACSSIGALGIGRELHEQLQSKGLEGNLLVANSLIDMYAKCGSIDDALKVFDRLPMKDVVTWNALLNGYAEHGDGEGAMKCFQEMCEQSVEPNDATFVCLLSACSHAGLVHEGEKCFEMMREQGIVPTDSHYNCMVNLLGRSGYLDKAEKLLQTAPLDNLVVGWTSLLSACKSHGDEERGGRCFDQLIRLEPKYASAYALVGDMYATAGRWMEVDRVERLRKYSGALKKPAKAYIELKNRVHEFTVGEDRCDVSSKMKSLCMRLREAGKTDLQMELVEKAVCALRKENGNCGHAEKLALAYGLLNTLDGNTLLITKDLRMCSDCHSSTKVMSRVEKREIIVRDAHRVHRFVDGTCSCGDGL